MEPAGSDGERRYSVTLVRIGYSRTPKADGALNRLPPRDTLTVDVMAVSKRDAQARATSNHPGYKAISVTEDA
jgi:hypothetical protein